MPLTEICVTYISREGGHAMPCGPHGEAPEPVGMEKRVRVRHRPRSLGVSMGRQSRQGRPAGVSHPGGLRGTGPDPVVWPLDWVDVGQGDY